MIEYTNIGPATKELEQQAIALGNNRKQLAKELLKSRSCLTDQYRKMFKIYTFDFENKRFISENGLFALQWRVRFYPNAPISYNNQQTSIGTCVVIELSSNEDHRLTL